MPLPTFYFIGGEDNDFRTLDTPSISTIAGTFRGSPYSRCAVYIDSGAMQCNQFTSLTSAWLRSYMYIYRDYAFRASLLLGLCSFGTRYKGLWLYTSSSGKLSLSKHDGSTNTVLQTEPGESIPVDTLLLVNMQVINYGAAANVKVYINDNLVIDYTGDVTVSGMTAFNCIQGSGYQLSTKYISAYLSEICVSDLDTRNILGIQTRYPSGAGDNNDFTGAYTDVDEITNSDADVVYTNNDGDEAQFAMPNAAAVDGRILGKKISARATKSADSSITQLLLGEKITGGAYDLDAGQEVSEGYATYDRYISGTETLAVANTKQIAMEVGT